jgi:hypothetical protein
MLAKKPEMQSKVSSLAMPRIWRLPWKKILIWLVMIGLVVILGIVAVKFVPGWIGSKEIKFENKEMPASSPTAPKENSIGSQLVPPTQENAKTSFGNETSNPKLKILDTSTGWLNVRDGSSLEGKVITKVYPGEEYEYTDKQNGWYQIILKDETSGWVYEKYIQTIGD